MNRYVFAGNTAVITGAASGIGRSLARDLAGRGSNLALVDRDAAGLTSLAASLSLAHPALLVSTHVVDLAVHQDFAPLAAEVRAGHRRIGLLVNNAGVALGGRFDEVSLEDIDWVMAINFRAPVALCKAFIDDLAALPGGHLVNVSSLFGLIAPAGQTAYAASKFALRGFTLSLQAEVTPRGVGVTVVHPGGIRTNVASNARIGSRVRAGAEDIGRRTAGMNALLTMAPEEAAALIARAIERRTPRLVITRRAKSADRLARAFPVLSARVIAASIRPARPGGTGKTGGPGRTGGTGRA